MCGLSTVHIQPSTLARAEKWNPELMRIETFSGVISIKSTKGKFAQVSENSENSTIHVRHGGVVRIKRTPRV
ncbi:hypothetical protein B9Z55_000671 [Caenorhabditis nigoni]|nr:hypothetical protein B9Z55_000671 [Caenorhabditis nigoni]